MSARMAKETPQFLMGVDGSLGYESAGDQLALVLAQVDHNGDNTLSARGDEMVAWDGLQCPADAFDPLGAASPPTIDNTTVPGTWLFSGTLENNLAIVRQMPHRWKQGGAIKPHVHWEKTTTGSGEVMWQWCYSIANVGAVFQAYSAWLDGTKCSAALRHGAQTCTRHLPRS